MATEEETESQIVKEGIDSDSRQVPGPRRREPTRRQQNPGHSAHAAAPTCALSRAGQRRRLGSRAARRGHSEATARRGLGQGPGLSGPRLRCPAGGGIETTRLPPGGCRRPKRHGGPGRHVARGGPSGRPLPPPPQPPRSCVKTDLSADVLVSGRWAGRDGHCGPRTSEVLRLQNRFNARMSVRSPAATSTALGVQRPPLGRHGPPLFASQPQRARPRPSFCRLHDSPEKRGAHPRGPPWR